MEAAQDLKKLYFRRKFSLTMFKNRQFRLSEISFFKDFTQEPEKTRGNLYRLLEMTSFSLAQLPTDAEATPKIYIAGCRREEDWLPIL